MHHSYFDTVILLEFVEEFLDLTIEESFDLLREQQQYNDIRRLSHTYCTDVFSMLEIDRCLIKFVNHSVIDYFTFQKSQNLGEVIKSDCMAYMNHLIKFVLLGFLKRCKLMV